MAQVNFRKPWFGPDSGRYRKGLQVVPDGLLDKLPSSAEVVEGPSVEDEAPKLPLKK